MISRPIFIGGMPRSGTTLMRAMIDRHPNIACGPELRVIPALASFTTQTRQFCGDNLQAYYGLTPAHLNDAFSALIGSFLEPYRAARGKARIAEKTPANVLHFTELNELFPDADFVHIIRDGRDVAASLLTMDWTDARTGAPMAMTRDPAIAAATWVRQVTAGLDAETAGVRIHKLHYENLVRDPRETLGALFEFLGERWSDDPLSFHLGEHIRAGVAEASADQIARPLYLQSVGRWRRDLSPAAKAAVKKQAGALLKKLDYADSDDW